MRARASPRVGSRRSLSARSGATLRSSATKRQLQSAPALSWSWRPPPPLLSAHDGRPDWQRTGAGLKGPGPQVVGRSAGKGSGSTDVSSAPGTSSCSSARAEECDRRGSGSEQRVGFAQGCGASVSPAGNAARSCAEHDSAACWVGEITTDLLPCSVTPEHATRPLAATVAGRPRQCCGDGRIRVEPPQTATAPFAPHGQTRLRGGNCPSKIALKPLVKKMGPPGVCAHRQAVARTCRNKDTLPCHAKW